MTLGLHPTVLDQQVTKAVAGEAGSCRRSDLVESALSVFSSPMRGIHSEAIHRGHYGVARSDQTSAIATTEDLPARAVVDERRNDEPRMMDSRLFPLPLSAQRGEVSGEMNRGPQSG